MEDGADAAGGNGPNDQTGPEATRHDDASRNATLFSSLIAQAPLGTYVVDGQLRVRLVNAHAWPVFASAQPVIGRELGEVMEILWGPEVGRRCVEFVRTTLATGERYVSPAFTETRHDLGIVQAYEWEAQRVTLPDGEHGVVCYFHDTTRAMQAMAALRASEQRMRLATEATRVGIWEWNIATNQIRWDAEMFRIYGITPTPGGVVEYTDWSGAVLPEDLAVNEAVLQDTVARCGHSRRTFRIRRRDDGECRDVEAVETVRTNGQGHAEWVVGTNLDITERTRAEAEARRLTAELAESSRRKDEFLATLAHELRNPLAPLRTGLQLLRASSQRDEDFERVCTMMERQLGHMVHLVDDLLDVSRISRGKLELRKHRVGLALAVTSAVETSRPLIEANRHELVVNLPALPIDVEADLTRLVQSFANLLNNAAKFTPAGGRIQVSVEREGPLAVVSVRDSGIGIPPEALPEIFDLFTQVDHSLERSASGLGIGLSLVKQLVEMHGGSIEARSEGRGKGSELVVRLPALESAESAAAPPAIDSPPPASGQRRILVADDNVDAADSLAMVLEHMGHEVRTAYDGQAAVEVAASFRPDLILLDIGMPTMNGYDACRCIRDQPGGRDAIVVALTGWGHDDDRRRSHEAGFDHHVVKPIDIATVKRLVELPAKP